MGLELLDEKGDHWSVEGTSLGSFVGDVIALGGAQGFCNGVEVQPLVSNLLEQRSREDRLCYAASWNQPAIFPVAEGPGGVICCAVVGQEPWVDVECGKARNANPA